METHVDGTNSKTITNTTLNSTGNLTIGISNGFWIGNNNISNFNAPFKGDLAEIIFIPSILNQENHNLVQGYLAHKWGVQSYLPNSHPYKNIPVTLI